MFIIILYCILNIYIQVRSVCSFLMLSCDEQYSLVRMIKNDYDMTF